MTGDERDELNRLLAENRRLRELSCPPFFVFQGSTVSIETQWSSTHPRSA